MPKRYVCKDCSIVESKKGDCKSCGKELDVIIFPWTFLTVLPYLSAGIASIFLIISYITDYFFLIGITFVFIGLGLILDHYYQKRLDKISKDIIR